jgi:transposase-like protein
MKRSKRYTEAERKDLISQFSHSQLSANAFCRAQGISTVSLALWRKRYSVHLPGPTSPRPTALGAAPTWVPVLVREDSTRPPPQAGYVLAADAARLEVPRGFDAHEVAALWQVLTSSTNAFGEVLP